jgi:PAS domain S-box-containing protein
MISFETLALLVNIALVVAIAIGARRKRTAPGIVALIALCAGIALWSVCYLLYQDPGLAALRPYAAAAAYFCATFVAGAAFWLIAARTNRQSWINLRNAALLAVMPVLTLAVGGYRTTQPGDAAPALAQLLTTATWSRIVAFYVLGMAGACALLLSDALYQRRRPILTRPGLAFLGSLLPLIVLLLEFASRSPFPTLELLPIGFALAALSYWNGLFDMRPEEIGSIDRAAAVEGMEDGWILLDADNAIVDMNSASERFSGFTREQILGQPISAVLGDLSKLGLTFSTSQEVEMKRSIQMEEGWRYLNIRVSPLTDRNRNPFGWITLWRDMTDRKLAEDARQRARDEMFVLLNAISSAASNTLSLDDFLLESIYHIIYPFRSQVVGIFLLDDKNKTPDQPKFQLASHLGLPSQALDELASVPGTSPLFTSIMNRGTPLQVKEAADDDRVPAALRNLPIECLLMLPLIARAGDDSKFLGCMCLARKEKPDFSADEIVRLTTIAEHMASLIDSDRRRKLAIAMTERERLMRDLHDSVSQKLYGLVTTTEAAQAALEAGSTVDPATEFARIGENARQAVKEMRLFLYQMQQVDVEKDGLVAVLHHRLSAVEGRADIKARLLTAEEDLALSTDKEMTLYYIAQEALNNVLRHARAKSVLVTLKQGQKNVILEIVDDGCGFDLKKVDRAGLGLQNMRERTLQLNGKLKIVTKPDAGTQVIVTVPRDPGMKPTKHARRT